MRELPISLERRARLIADAGIGTGLRSVSDIRDAIYEQALKTLREVAAEARKGG